MDSMTLQYYITASMKLSSQMLLDSWNSRGKQKFIYDKLGRVARSWCNSKIQFDIYLYVAKS